MEKNEKTHFIVRYLTETLNDLNAYLLQHPEKLIPKQFNYWQAHTELCRDFLMNESSSKNNNIAPDKRFKNDKWQNNLIFNFIQRAYQLFSQHSENFVGDLARDDKMTAQKIQFYTHQFVDSIAPSNFINTNPEILEKIVETNGANLIEGLKRFKDDLEQGNGQWLIELTDKSQFEIGKNIACTSGNIIYQNDLIQLIQYTPTTNTVYQHPVLIIPPWINKYYILDLQQENSFVKWLLDQNHPVFMISWVNPTLVHRHKNFSDYLSEGPLAAIKVIQETTGNKKINLMGYCIGGTLLACLLAYLAKKKSETHILSATFLTTMLDFSEPGELGTFIDEKQISMLEAHMNRQGYLDGNIYASVFRALRANDLIWSAFINQYLKGEKPKAFDLLYWNGDSTNVPAPAHSFYLRNMYLNNLLVKPGKVKINNIPLDLSKINIPCYFLACHDDHIIPWKSCYQSQRYLKKSKFVLAGSGHVAGVINPPYKNKYGYWTAKSLPKEVDNFLSKATFHEGSWWLSWNNWIKPYSGKLIPAISLNLKRKRVVEPAPGSYVKVKCHLKQE